MPSIAQIPDDLLTLDVGAWVMDTKSRHLLNDFVTDSRQTTGDITATNQGGNGAIAEPGETVTVPGGTGNVTGAYVGPVTLSTVNVTVDIPALAGINVKLNDIDGHAIRAGDGSGYMISDQPLTEDRLGAGVSVELLGENIQLLDLPISAINNALAARIDTIANGLGPFAGAPFRAISLGLRSTADLGQTVIDRVTLNVERGDGPLAVTCLARGTLIQTEHGPVAIEDLAEGMLVATRDNGLQLLRWVGSLTLAAHPQIRPIRIRAGALGPNRPVQDLIVSPQDRILICSRIARRMFDADEVLAPAKQLLQIEGIDIATDLTSIDYFHFLFDRHEIVSSNGAETESLRTGPVALESVSKAARQEILTILPELLDEGFFRESARILATGRQARKLAIRHLQNGKPLVQ